MSIKKITIPAKSAKPEQLVDIYFCDRCKRRIGQKYSSCYDCDKHFHDACLYHLSICTLQKNTLLWYVLVLGGITDPIMVHFVITALRKGNRNVEKELNDNPSLVGKIANISWVCFNNFISLPSRRFLRCSLTEVI